MKVLDDVPPQLEKRFAPNAVPILCDCGTHMLWERANGSAVTCPKCKRVETLDLDGACTVSDPALKSKPGDMFVG